MKTLIEAVTLVPMDGREPIEDASIHIDGQTIAYAGPREDAPGFAADSTIAGRNRIAMPGLVNAHTHVPMTLLRGLGTDLPLHRWLTEAMFPVEDRMTEEDIYWGSMLGIMEMIRFGATSFLDMYMFEEEIAQAVEKTGARAVLHRSILGTDQGDEYRIAESEALFRNWDGACDGRIRVFTGPHAEYTTNPEMIRKIVEHADKLGCGVHLHLSETQAEVDGCVARHGVTPVRYFENMGMFDRHAVAAHCVAITENDAEILERKGVYIAHNPISNLKLGSGVMPLFQGLLPRTALGTDGAASNNTLNMMEELRVAALLHKGAMRDATVMKAGQALAMATANGAQALGFDDVGALSQGMKADLILIKTTGAHAAPMHDSVSHIAYAAQGSDVSLTMVDGRIIYEEGQFSTFDAQEVIAQAKLCAKRLMGI